MYNVDLFKDVPRQRGWFIVLNDIEALEYAANCFNRAADLKRTDGLHGAARDILNAWATDVNNRAMLDRHFDAPFLFVAWNVFETFIVWLNSTGNLVDRFMQLAGDRGRTGYLTRLESDNSNLQLTCRFFADQFRDTELYPTLTAELERVAGVFQRDIKARLDR